jgi:hypothetical protein
VLVDLLIQIEAVVLASAPFGALAVDAKRVFRKNGKNRDRVLRPTTREIINRCSFWTIEALRA